MLRRLSRIAVAWTSVFLAAAKPALPQAYAFKSTRWNIHTQRTALWLLSTSCDSLVSLPTAHESEGRQMIKLVLVDDHDIVRTGISHIIEKDPNMKIVGEAGDGEEGLRMVRQLKPDVVLMDVNMPKLGGLEATRRIHQSQPQSRVIILTVHTEAPFPTHLLDAGATGYLTKGCAADDLLNAIRSVAKGQKYIGKDIAQRLALSLLPGAEKCPFDELSAREMEIVLMLVRAQEINDIAESLALSPKTVSTYKYRLYDKLGLKNTVELTHLAIRHGILDS